MRARLRIEEKACSGQNKMIPGWRRGSRRCAQAVSTRLDADVVAWLKESGPGLSDAGESNFAGEDDEGTGELSAWLLIFTLLIILFRFIGAALPCRAGFIAFGAPTDG